MEKGLASCWGNLKLMFQWRRKKRFSKQIRGNKCSFKYDPLSYAQNFDEGCLDEDDEDSSFRGFSSRYAAPSSKSIEEGPCMM